MKTRWKVLASAVFWLHCVWAVLLVVGTIMLFVFPPYRPVHRTIIVITVVANLWWRGTCPLVPLENALERRYDPNHVHHPSFVRHYVKKYTGVDLPQQCANGIIAVVSAITFIQWIWE